MKILSVVIQVFLVATCALALPAYNPEQSTILDATTTNLIRHEYDQHANSSLAANIIARDVDYMSILDYWRVRVGVPTLAWSAQLQANALDTVVSGGGQMVHKLNPGTLAQVLAPGNPGSFENVWVGGWLCEIPTLPGLDGCCAQWSQGWAYNGQTAHAQIVSSTAYSHIGCALANGIWGCDLGNA